MAKFEAKTAIVTRSIWWDRACCGKAAGAGWLFGSFTVCRERGQGQAGRKRDQSCSWSSSSSKADPSKEDEVASLFEQSLSKLGQVDVVVHSAGVMPLPPMIKMT